MTSLVMGNWSEAITFQTIMRFGNHRNHSHLDQDHYDHIHLHYNNHHHFYHNYHNNHLNIITGLKINCDTFHYSLWFTNICCKLFILYMSINIYLNIRKLSSLQVSDTVIVDILFPSHILRNFHGHQMTVQATSINLWKINWLKSKLYLWLIS